MHELPEALLAGGDDVTLFGATSQSWKERLPEGVGAVDQEVVHSVASFCRGVRPRMPRAIATAEDATKAGSVQAAMAARKPESTRDQIPSKAVADDDSQ